MSNPRTPNPPSKHHYIPEFLLKRWAGQDGRVMRFTSPIPGKFEKRLCYPSQVGFERDLYRSPKLDIVEAQRLEAQFFSTLDNVAAKALENLLIPGSRSLDRPSLEVWCVFIFALLHRSPAYFRALIQSGKQELSLVMERLESEYESLRSKNDPATFAEFAAGKDEVYAEMRTFDIVPDLILNSNVIEFMHKMHWAVLCIGDMTPNLLLSDDPVVRTNGIKRDGGHVALPISPSHLMIGAWQPETLRALQQTPPTVLVKQTNEQTVEAARSFVVATDQHQSRFIENRFGKRPRPPLL